MVDVAVLVSRVRGVITNPKETLAEHMRPVPPWSVVTREHVLPLLVVSGLIASLIFLAFAPIGQTPGMPAPDLMEVLRGFVLRIVINLIALVVVTVVIGVMAILFDGQPRFNGAFTLVALAMTPLYLTEAVAFLPLIGPILFVAGLVYSLMILYQGVPMALQVPDNKRVFHFVLTMATTVVLMVVITAALVPVIDPITGAPAP